MLSELRDDANLPTTRMAGAAPLVWMLIWTSLGIMADRWSMGSWPVYSIVLAGALGVGLVGWRRSSAPWRNLSIALMATGTGAIWHHVYWNVFPADHISRWTIDDAQPAALEGELLQELRLLSQPSDVYLSIADEAPRHVTLIRARRIRIDGDWQTCSGLVHVLLEGQYNLHTGNVIRVFGELQHVEGSRNPGEFNFEDYYRSRRILARLFVRGPEQVTVVSTSTWGWQAFRGMLRTRFRKEIETRVSAEQAALANAILLGNREGLDQEARREFMMTGTVHVLAISGLHVGILSVAVYQWLRFFRLPRRWNLLFSIAFVIFYAWLVEFRAPVTRAMILITCVCLSRLSGRSGFSLNVLALAGLVVLAMNPADLFSLGSQLSFLAVFTMSIFLSPERAEADPVRRLIVTTRGPVAIWFRKSVYNFVTATAVSALIWIVTVPLVARNFHLFAPSGLFVNPVVLLPMTTALFGGLLTILFSGWFALGAMVGGWICSKSLAVIQWLVATGSHAPGGHFWTSGPTAAAVVLFYIGLLLICLRYDINRSRRQLIPWFVAWLGLGWLGPAAWQKWQAARESATWTATVIDVGHGSSVLVQLPGDEVLLYDAGSFGSSEAATRAISSVLWSEGIHHIDALVISHADLDHYNGAPELCERFSIGRVFVPGHFMTTASPGVEFARAQFREKGIEVEIVWRGLNLKTGSGSRIRVLNPSPYDARGSDNAQSIVLEISACGRTLILPGDLEPPGLQQVLQMDATDADVALMPHHGSMGSDPVSFLGWCRPEMAVISGEKHTLRIDAKEQTVLGPCQVVSTAELGAIRIRFSEDQVGWQSWIADNRRLDRAVFGNSWHLLTRKGDNTDDRIGQFPAARH